jgi:hypothetical protein
MMRWYLSERFPIVSQGGAVLSAYACCYLLYGQAQGQQRFGIGVIVGAVTMVLLALLRRIADDLEDLNEDALGKERSFSGARNVRPRHLLTGASTVIVLVIAFNAACSISMLAVSLAISGWLLLGTALKRTASGSVTFELVLTESFAVVILLYSYVAWQATAGESLSAPAVAAIVGLLWMAFEFWGWTRKLGGQGWPPWGRTLSQTRILLVLLLLAEAVFGVLVSHYAHLGKTFLPVALLLPAAFVVSVLRWFSRLPAENADGIKARWAGLPLVVGVEVGVLLAVATAI